MTGSEIKVGQKYGFRLKHSAREPLLQV